ncbi:MAG: EscU/YscU/HrcU family type III secretion system export apparatus switch protein, partial [Spirochaetota bacterium]
MHKLPKEMEIYPRIDLQLFAAEDEGRTEEGSERRRKEEIEKGNIPKSQELPGSLVLIVGVIAMYFLGNHIFINSLLIIKKYFTNLKQYEQFTVESFVRLFRVASEDIFTLLAPMLLITFITALVGSLVQVGFMFSPKAVAFNFKKITPNFKKVLPTRQTIFNLLKSIAKVALIGWVSYIIISMDF